MDLFTSPGWDADDACEDLNKKLFGSTSYSVSASNKKSRESGRKIAKAERKRSPNKVSPRSQNIAKAKQEVLSELKGRFAKKRKLDEDIDGTPQTSLLNVQSKKAVRFKVDADDNVVVDVKVMSAKKTSKKNKLKQRTPKEADVNSQKNNTPGGLGQNKCAKLFSKITKKKAKLDQKQTKINIFENGKIKKNVTSKETNGTCAVESVSMQENDCSVTKTTSKGTGNISKINSVKPCTASVQISKVQQKKSKHIFFNSENAGSLTKNANTCHAPAKPSAESITSVTQSNKNTSTPLRQQISKPVRPKLNSNELKTLNRRNPGTLRERMMRKLQASRFRYLNEQMYCSKGSEALEYFQTDPAAFEAYHQGYRSQVAQWPLNPIDKIINALKKKSPNLVIADFGCGDAKLARSLPNKVHSFDLVSVSPEVTACDMARTPLARATVDVAVFCLSLMGTNLADYLKEANRVLKPGGILKIAEVESRFENIDAFINSLRNYGFDVTNKDLSNNLFYFIDLKKADNIKKKKSTVLPEVTLKPCLYKKR